MSSRWYPIYQKGNPQLRIFLPNFWMKLVRPQNEQPPNIVQFITSVQMTDHDIKNYLEKIYKIPVINVRSRIEEGTLRRVPQKGYVVKDDDYRRAFVTLPAGEKFEFPDICEERVKTEETEMKKMQDQAGESFKRFSNRNLNRPGVPGWFSF